MKNILLTMLLFGLAACSWIPPSSKEFKHMMDKEIGKNIKDDYFYGSEFYKIQQDKDKKYYYDKSYNYSTKAECKVLYVTDMQDTIIDYKILTPDTCKIGLSPAW